MHPGAAPIGWRAEAGTAMASIGFGDIKAQAAAWKSISLTSVAELGRCTPGMLAVAEGLGTSERMLAVTAGEVWSERCLLVLTNQRLLIVKAAFFSDVEQTALPLDQIEQVSMRKAGLGEPDVLIDSSQTFVIEGADQAQMFAGLLQQAVGEAKSFRYDRPRPRPQIADGSLAPAADAPVLGEDLVSQLERLGALRDKGVITESEFRDLKARLLGL